MIQLHITMTPSITRDGRYRKREWVKNAKIPFDPFSEGAYCLMWEGFDYDNGTLLKGFRVVMNCCLFREAGRLEDELRKSGIIITKIEAIKNI